MVAARAVCTVTAAAAILVTSATPSRAQTALDALQDGITSVVRAARGGVVTIEDAAALEGPVGTSNQTDSKSAAAADAAGGKPGATGLAEAASRTPARAGTGFVIDDGYVLTTDDVLEGMVHPLVVTDDGVSYHAFTVCTDPELNIGLLRLPDGAKVPAMRLGSSGGLEPGRLGVVIGNRTGEANAVALAVISGIRRDGTFAGRHFYSSLIETAGTVGAGSSGAPLLDTHGAVLGMIAAVPAASVADARPAPPGDHQTTAPASSPLLSSAGLAIPVDELKRVVLAMTKAKGYARAWLGVELRQSGRLVDDGATVRVERTLQISVVRPDSPAMHADLRVGDRITAVDGSPIRTLADFRTAVVRHTTYAPFEMDLVRNGRSLHVSVRSESRRLGR